jgi:hypothetical protein
MDAAALGFENYERFWNRVIELIMFEISCSKKLRLLVGFIAGCEESRCSSHP